MFAGLGWTPSRSTLGNIETAAEFALRPLAEYLRGYLKHASRLPVVAFDFTVSRHRDGPDEVLWDYQGNLLGDCWTGFQIAGVFRVTCWVPIDNNDCEQSMKRVATGRKNWLFKGSVAAGDRAANLMTIIGTAIRNDLDVSVYLNDVLQRALDGQTNWGSLSPDRWKASHGESVRAYRQEERRQAADRKRTRRASRHVKKK